MTIGLSFALTLVIFSYLLADNLLYRLAIATFVGIAAAFTTIVIVESVLVPLADGTGFNAFLLVSALLLTLLLLFRYLAVRRLLVFAPLANIAIAYLVAVGTAAAMVGALTGTMIPLMRDTATIDTTDLLSIVNGVVVVIGVVSSLLYFQYLARQNPDGSVERPRALKVIANIGEGFIMITLGAIYGAAILTSLTILTGQLSIILAGL